MFKFKSYNVKKTEEKKEKEQCKASYSTGTLKKSSSATKSSSYVSPKQKTMPTANEIKAVSNIESPEYSTKIYPKKSVTKWNNNTTYSAKKNTKKVVIPSPHKKLERK